LATVHILARTINLFFKFEVLSKLFIKIV
jgi:hypothetical protein